MFDASINLRAKPEQRDLLDPVHFRLDAQKFKHFTRHLGCSALGQRGGRTPDGREGTLGWAWWQEVCTLNRTSNPRSCS